VYDLTLREEPFHGVRAIRLNPVDESKMKKANAAEPPKSKAVTKAPVTASKAGNNAHSAQSATDMSAAHAADL